MTRYYKKFQLSNKSLKNVLKIFSYIFFGLAIFYIFNQIVSNWNQLNKGIKYFNIKYFIFYIFLLQGFFWYQVNLWRIIIKGLGSKLDFFRCAYMYFSNNLLSYVPGKVANALGMVSIANRYKISVKNTITTIVLFQIYSLISGTLLISIFSFFSDRNIISYLNLDNIWILFIASFIGLIAIYPTFQAYSLKIIENFTGKKINNLNTPFNSSLFNIFLYGIGWLLSSLSFFMLLKTFILNNEILIFPLVVVILITSYLSGLFAFVVPAGFGILEAGLIYGMGNIFQVDQIILVVVFYRLGNIISTVLSWLILRIILFLRKSN